MLVFEPKEQGSGSMVSDFVDEKMDICFYIFFHRQ